jgi:hypothetical protein
VIIHRAARDRIQTRIVWRGGAVSELSIPVAVGSLAGLSCATELESRALELVRAGNSDLEIAQRLSLEKNGITRVQLLRQLRSIIG